MSLDGNGTGTKNSHSAAPIDSARAALISLLKTTRMEKIPSQEILAKQLKKEIEDLRSVGVSFEAISVHLKASGIIISKKMLGAAVKKRVRRNAGTKPVGAAPTERHSSSAVSTV